MQLIVLHQILIASAIGLSGIFGVRSLVLFSRGAGGINFVLFVASALVAAGLSLYLRKVRARWLASRGR